MTYPPSGYDPKDFDPVQPGHVPPQSGYTGPQGYPEGYTGGQPYVAPQDYGQQPGYAPPGYPQPAGYYPGQAYYGAPPPDHPQALVVLILGIFSLVLCQLLGPVAWILGSKARNDIRASNGAMGGMGMVMAGWICGIVSSVLIILGVLFIVLLVVLAAAGVSQ